MKILAIDASTRSTGFALGEQSNLQEHGCIQASSKDVVKRIIKMRDSLSKIIKDNKVNKVVLQQVRPEYNSHTSKVLMWLQAAIVIAAYEVNPEIEFEFIPATTWRAALKFKQGRGVTRDMVKPQDVKYVEDKYGIKVNDDEADAICIFDVYWQKFDNELNWG